MTKLPVEDRSVSGVEGPQYPLNNMCPVPGCGMQATETHHIFRRSFLIGDYAWVRMPEGSLVGNLVRLCGQHHHMLTINAAWMKIEDGVFTWGDMVNASQPLLWQPPWRDDDELRRSDSRDAGDHPGVDDPDLLVSPLADQPAHEPHDGTCPTCLRPLPHKRENTEARRERRTWSITVPKDEREDGAETLDQQLEAARQAMARAGLPYGSESAVKFFVLSQALGLFVTHADDVLT